MKPAQSRLSTIIRRLLRLLLVLALLAGCALAIWWAMRPTPVTTVTPVRGDAAEIVYATGVVEPRDWAQLAPLARGRIEYLCQCEGEWVEQGSVLARLDDREAKARLEELTTRAAQADDDLARMERLAQQRAVSQQSLDQARSDAYRARALASAQETLLDHHVLRAPLAGEVLRQDAEIGEIAGPDQALFWVGQPQKLQVVAEVNEEDIPDVESGQRVLIHADAFPERKLEAKVIRVTPKGDPVARTYRVYLELPEGTPLRIGMSVEANIITRVVNNAQLLPIEAFQQDEVFIVDNDEAQRRTLDVGIRGTERVEVVTPLEEGTQVISPWPTELSEGDQVTISAGDSAWYP
ncbi:efflux RND transporter periplasmic adaptor subunit [Halomonas huangheensis]|uniref:CusB-like beta-barrel domain-containing protein n=1 Tax=Halomonas huangheensis TaxID=1178482 RepID=W1NA30_9GAMM|nr:efflux RND transporter periplasmic adaptor subunit [Halomonas huangheensis]ALM53969.1 RND transporter [Halomonas huangheensis]ERL52071.1 hypothetical protein BJB45_08900 [Halomonas huangheensis]